MHPKSSERKAEYLYYNISLISKKALVFEVQGVTFFYRIRNLNKCGFCLTIKNMRLLESRACLLSIERQDMVIM